MNIPRLPTKMQTGWPYKPFSAIGTTAQRKGQSPAGCWPGADTSSLLLLSQLVLHLGAGRCSHWQPAPSALTAGILRDWPLLEGVTALSSPGLPLPEHLLPPSAGVPPSSFLSPPGSPPCVGVSCSSEPEAAPQRVGTRDRVLTSV